MAKYCAICREDCYETCAMYDKEYQQCSILSLAVNTGIIGTLLKKSCDSMERLAEEEGKRNKLEKS